MIKKLRLNGYIYKLTLKRKLTKKECYKPLQDTSLDAFHKSLSTD